MQGLSDGILPPFILTCVVNAEKKDEQHCYEIFQAKLFKMSEVHEPATDQWPCANYVQYVL